MKKALFLILLLGGMLSANAAEITYIYGGREYHNGDTITLYVEQNAHGFDELYIRNDAGSALTNAKVYLTLIENSTLEVWGLCTGDNCVTGLVSAPFDIAAGATYENFSFDLRGTADNGNYALYKMEIKDVVTYVRFEVGTASGIDEVAANIQAVAYPNPAQGMVSIRYAVAQPASLVVYDAQGRQVRRRSVSGEGTLQLGDLPAGIYAYGFVTEGVRSTMRKLVVK